MNRVRNIFQLPSEQNNDWQFFAKHWDQKNAAAHGPEWAKIFAEILQNLVNKQAEGDGNALSEFMRSESERVLGGTPTLRLPGTGRTSGK